MAHSFDVFDAAGTHACVLARVMAAKQVTLVNCIVKLTSVLLNPVFL